MNLRRSALGLAAIGAALVPRRDLDRAPTLCGFRLITGYPCPTCGMTRSWHSVVHLEPMRAVRDHPFGPLIMAAIATGTWSPATADVLGARAMRLPARIKAIALIAWLGWWASRLLATHRSRARAA